VTVDVKTRLLPPIEVETTNGKSCVPFCRDTCPAARSGPSAHERQAGVCVGFRFDIAVGGEELALDEMAMLREALDESRLPFKVDVVQMAALTPEFRARIEPSLVLVQG